MAALGVSPKSYSDTVNDTLKVPRVGNGVYGQVFCSCVASSKGSVHIGILYVVIRLKGFAQAVATLWEHQETEVEAVHLAIALAYHGLLRVPLRAETSDLTPRE